MSPWLNKKVLVMGLGIQGGGVGVARYFAKHGALVTVTDLKNNSELADSVVKLAHYPHILFHLNGHHEDDFVNTDLIVKGPSIPWDNIFIQEAQRKSIPVIMETAYFVKHTNATVIGVTGTRGKSTTTTCIYTTLKHFYTKGNVYIAGNVPGTCAIELLDSTKGNDIVVLELSSWQLSGFHRMRISPHIAVFTNIYEDHLNFYKNIVQYVYDKTAIFAYQKPLDTLIATSNALSSLKTNKVTIPSQVIETTESDFNEELLYIRGHHNKLNAALALTTVAKVLPEIDKQSIVSCIRDVKSVRFRQEIIEVQDTITIVNDSTSTTPIATITAIETFRDRNIILILGGNSKNLSLNGLVACIEQYKKKISSIVLLKGTMTDEILPELSKIDSIKLTEMYSDFDLAVQRSFDEAKQAVQPVYILFSPGATSFAQFRNEFDRGEKFSAVVSDIMRE